MVPQPELIPPHVHRALLYIETLNSAGVRPTEQQVEAYVSSPRPQDAIYETHLAKTMGEIARQVALYGGPSRKIRDAEPVVDYVRRMEWITSTSGGLGLTRLGSALVAGLRADGKSPRASDSVEDIAVTVLDPSDPFVYTNATRRIAEAGKSMLVDPYFKAASLSWLQNATNIDRLLVSAAKVNQAKEVEAIKLALYGLEASGQQVAVDIRATRSTTLHDRCIVPDKGAVLLLGTSLTGIGHHLSSITPMPNSASTTFRRQMKDLWTKASAVEATPIVAPPTIPATIGV